MHKSGFVNIIGNPNVGKSTLMNALVGEKLSIITSKAQTTRHRIMGIVSSEDFQIVYSDTPGILKPSYKLQESMMKFVTGAVADADVILYVTDTVERGERSAEIIDRIRQSGVPAIVVINKIDLTTPEALEALVDKWQGELPEARIVPASAKENFNIEGLFKTILDLLPEGPAFYPKDTLTDKTLRFFASEIIREKILRFYDKEILKKAAEESGIVEELFEKADEKPTNSFLYSLSMGTHGQAMNFTNYNDYLTNDKLFLFQSNTIRDMAEKDSCVIIGRCADYILRGRKDMLSVFIHAPMELRIHSYELTLRLADAEKIEITDVRDGVLPRPQNPDLSTIEQSKPHPGLGEGGKYHIKATENPLPDTELLTFALAGNQNCGKTTLFNQLTGSNQHVGNFPGVTVDRKDGMIRGKSNTLVTDLPGIYSMSPYSSEELVTRNFLLDEHPCHQH